MAKPAMALPNMEITLPTVMMVKSLVHRDDEVCFRSMAASIPQRADPFKTEKTPREGAFFVRLGLGEDGLEQFGVLGNLTLHDFGRELLLEGGHALGALL